MKRLLSAFVAATALLGAASAAHANLSIDKLWVDFRDGRPGRSDVVIRNDSEERYYIDVTVAEIINPGAEDEERRTIADPEALGLLVTPNRLILEPGALRSIRLVSLNEELTQDRVYRVLVKPQVGEIQSDLTPVDGGPAIVMKLMAAYDVLVTARPRGGEAVLTAERSGSAITLRNAGNTNTLLSEGRICPKGTSETDQSDLCQAISATRIYAGTTLKLDMTSEDDVVFIKTQDNPSAALVDRKF